MEFKWLSQAEERLRGKSDRKGFKKPQWSVQTLFKVKHLLGGRGVSHDQINLRNDHEKSSTFYPWVSAFGCSSGASDSVSWRTLRKVWTTLSLLSLYCRKDQWEPRGPRLGDLESRWKLWNVHFLISFCILIRDGSPDWQTARANWPPNVVRARLLEDRSLYL